jgi:hypothetical protein
MADNCVFNRESGEIGDKIRINGHDCIVQNSYKLVTNPTTNETYYEIKLLTNDNIVIIDECSGDCDLSWSRISKFSIAQI